MTRRLDQYVNHDPRLIFDARLVFEEIRGISETVQGCDVVTDLQCCFKSPAVLTGECMHASLVEMCRLSRDNDIARPVSIVLNQAFHRSRAQDVAECDGI